jgi:hypothetical protein
MDIPHMNKSNNCGPAATAGLKAHQEIPPAAYAAVITVSQIANP